MRRRQAARIMELREQEIAAVQASASEAKISSSVQRRVDMWLQGKDTLRKMLAGLHALLPRIHALATPRVEPFRALHAAEGTVQKRYRKVLRLVHPDKLSPQVPTSERVAAQLVFPLLVSMQRSEKERRDNRTGRGRDSRTGSGTK